MNITELNSKISSSIEELKKDIIEYVKQNAKLKIGDIVEAPYNLGNKITYAVITQIGFDKNYGIVYHGQKVKKDTGEVSFQSMGYGTMAL